MSLAREERLRTVKDALRRRSLAGVTFILKDLPSLSRVYRSFLHYDAAATRKAA